MKKSKLIIMGIVLVSGLTGLYLFLDRGEAPAPAPVAAAPPPPPPANEVLVAAHELSFGAVVQPQDLAWQPWPKDSMIQGVLHKDETPNAIDELKDSVVRGSFIAGEPIRREKLFKGGSSGYLSAILTPGYRAVAINIEGSGSTTAGNFVLPNDRVDVIRIYRDEDAAKTGAGDAYVSETLVTNVRVLAIGQNAQDKGGQPFASGSTATLELDPQQAETVILAQRVGQLWLVLRAMQDGANASSAIPGTPEQQNRDKSVTVVRAGVATQSRGK
jgi:pilus assembly protein CpaB